ncbi:MAG: hypothetical protein WDA59_09135 [Methanofastidiosum sp.]
MNSYYISRIIIGGDNGKIEFTVRDLNDDEYIEVYIIDTDCDGNPYIMNIVELKEREEKYGR